MLKEDGKYLVALSGGADSVTLLLVLENLGYHIDAVHCNFHLRGAESDRDELFCKVLCERRGITLHTAHFDTIAYSQLHKMSIEMAARDLRYNYFEHLRHDIQADAICVAHHRDDSVETLFINLIRGTGLNGLVGISPRNGFIIRPLLCVSRNDIIDYLSSIKQNYVTDSTNLVDDVTRNKIRLDIIPKLAEINPSVCLNISKTADRLRDAAKIFNHALDESAKRVIQYQDEKQCVISIPNLKKEISPEYTLFHIIRDYGFSSAQISQIAEHIEVESGREWNSKTHNLLIDRNTILIEPVDNDNHRSMRILECGTYIFSEEEKFKFKLIPIDASFQVSKELNVVSLDADKIHFPLLIRRLNDGDRFVPFGMKGSKLVSDFLTDRKISLFDKRRQLVITDANGDIMWLVSQRPDNRFRITPKSRMALNILLESGK